MCTNFFFCLCINPYQKDELGDAFNEDDRSKMWIIARQDEKGEFLNDATKEMAGKIVSFRNPLSF